MDIDEDIDPDEDVSVKGKEICDKHGYVF